MALYSPDTLRRRGVTPFAPDDDIGAGIATPPAAAGTVAGQDVRAAGTAAGQLVRKGIRAGTNAAIAGTNAANGAVVGGINALTYPGRVVAGVARDFTNAVAGKPVDANAGEPAPALQAPSIATIDWNKVDSARGGQPGPGFANVQSNVAMAPAAPAAGPKFGNVQSGATTLNRPSLVDAGVTLPDGRKLPYGAMVNGVPTFSDGSGGFAGHAATIPRTMTDADIAGLGDRLNTVPASAFTQAPPAFNSTNSDANIAAIQRSRQGGKFGISPEQNAAADLAAVTNQDPRSTLGRAALNASRSANAAGTTLQRKAALGGLASLQDAVAKSALEGIADPAALARVNAEGQSSLQRQALANQGDLARQGLANEGDLARTDLAGKYDVAGRLAQGQAKTTLTDKDLNAQAIKLLPQVLGLNALGQIDDKTAPGGTRAATEQEIASGLARAKAIIQGQLAPANNAAPAAGEVRNGYRFKGGNPNDKASWEKV